MSNNAHHRNLMSDYYCAVQAWWEKAEFETQLYATELSEYVLINPRPLFKQFLINQKEVRNGYNFA